jgi:hypothetical protein
MAFALLLSTVAALAVATAPSGEAEALTRMAPAFSGTIVAVYPDGREGKLWLSEDKTYRYTGRTGVQSSGAWGFSKGYDRVCMKQHRPIFIPFGYCTPIPATTTWTAKARTGEVLQLHIDPARES